MTRPEIAVENFMKGCNCSQSVISAFAEDLGMSRDTAMCISEGFGGGMGRMRSVCGAVSAMFMACGLKLSKGDPKDTETRALIYKTVQEMAAEFKEKYGTIVCAELLKGISTSSGSVPTTRDAKFYKERPCAQFVEYAAEIVERKLMSL